MTPNLPGDGPGVEELIMALSAPVWQLTIRWDDKRECYWVSARKCHPGRGSSLEPAIIVRLESATKTELDHVAMVLLVQQLQRAYEQLLPF